MSARTLLVSEDYTTCASPVIGGFRKAADRRLKKKSNHVHTLINRGRWIVRLLSTPRNSVGTRPRNSRIYSIVPTSHFQSHERLRTFEVFLCHLSFSIDNYSNNAYILFVFIICIYNRTFLLTKSQHFIIENLIKKLKFQVILFCLYRMYVKYMFLFHYKEFLHT